MVVNSLFLNGTSAQTKQQTLHFFHFRFSFTYHVAKQVKKKLQSWRDGSDSAALTVLRLGTALKVEKIVLMDKENIAQLAGNPQRATLDRMEVRSALLVP